MSDLLQQLTATLIQPAPPKPTVTKPTVYGTAKSNLAPKVNHTGFPDSVPPRPEELFEYQISYYRTEYGSLVITAASTDEALQDADYCDIEWYDYGEAESSDWDQVSSGCVNQDKIDDWDDQYSNQYNSDGEPVCSDCRDETDVVELTVVPEGWLCKDCAAHSPSNNL
jgi:hypothetical protein